jgi:glycosyltransferase involved in cell wall biosynthesis
MDDRPRVSVLLPVYNGELYVRDAVESVLAQTFQKYELVIIDDGSTDQTAAILDGYQQLNSCIRLYHHAKNQGLIATLNHGLDLVRGEYLARIDADDISLPDRFTQQVHILDADPDLVIIGSAYELIGAQGEVLRIDRHPQNDTSIRWKLLFQCSFAHPSVMIRIETLRKGNLKYDVNMLHGEDYDLWSRLLNYGKGGNIGVPLIQHRVHSAQLTQLFPAAIHDIADQISQQNLLKLNITIPIEEVKTLRSWYNRFPTRLNQADQKLTRSLIHIVQEFYREPGLDLQIASQIRVRVAMRLLKATPLSLWKYLWMNDLPKILRPNDTPIMFKLAITYLLRSIKKKRNG